LLFISFNYVLYCLGKYKVRNLHYFSTFRNGSRKGGNILASTIQGKTMKNAEMRKRGEMQKRKNESTQLQKGETLKQEGLQ
jgi:hypothetical protein